MLNEHWFVATFPQNIIKIGQQSTFDLVIAERKRVPFFETQCR